MVRSRSREPGGREAERPARRQDKGARLRIGLAGHQESLADDELFHAAVLLHTYALAEAVAQEALARRGVPFGAGIESWGLALLASRPGPGGPRGWTSTLVEADLVETAVHRNVYAHGQRHLDERSATRLRRVGCTSSAAGDGISLPYDALRGHRARLRQLLRDGGLGADR